MKNQMIEFTGLYSQGADAEAKRVLVQFDGALLHVWHLSNPFYRLHSIDLLRICLTLSKDQCHIKLPNGARIETHDLNAVLLLQKQRHRPFSSRILDYLENPKAIVIMVFIFVAFSAWFIAKYSLPCQ